MTSSAEIESIVRRVLATLTGGATSLSNAISHTVPPTTLSLADNVVSVLSIRERLRGIQVLEIGKSAVMTPAARDYCKEHRVEIVRGNVADLPNSLTTENSIAGAVRPQRLLIAGTPLWMPSISKQLCAKQAYVCPTASDDSTALKTIADGLRAGHHAGVAIVHSPHAACWQAARDDRMRPAVVPNWSELNDVLREVPVNVLILSSKTWNVPSVCNGVRRFFQHLQIQS